MKQTISGFQAKISNNHPIILGSVKVTIVVFVPKRFLIKPEIIHDNAPPKGIIETDHENSFAVIANL